MPTLYIALSGITVILVAVTAYAHGYTNGRDTATAAYEAAIDTL